MSTPAVTAPLPTGQDVADFLGQGQDPTVLALAGEHVPIVTAMARSYTRGNGFNTDGTAAEDVAAVITTATARLVTNPAGTIAEQVDPSYNIRYAPTGWTLAETLVLNRYRKRAQ